MQNKLWYILIEIYKTCYIYLSIIYIGSVTKLNIHLGVLHSFSGSFPGSYGIISSFCAAQKETQCKEIIGPQEAICMTHLV